MNFDFMMGSMGFIVGEKIIYLIEYVVENNLFIIICFVLGGVRM